MPPVCFARMQAAWQSVEGCAELLRGCIAPWNASQTFWLSFQMGLTMFCIAQGIMARLAAREPPGATVPGWPMVTKTCAVQPRGYKPVLPRGRPSGEASRRGTRRPTMSSGLLQRACARTVFANAAEQAMLRQITRHEVHLGVRRGAQSSQGAAAVAAAAAVVTGPLATATEPVSRLRRPPP